MVTRAEVEEFLTGGDWAVVGASQDRRKFGNTVFRELKKRGRQVYPINKNATQVEGEPCYASLADLPGKVDRVVLVVPPEQTEVVVKEAADAGISRVWMQQGSESDAAAAYSRSRGMTVVSGQCILMSLGQTDIRDRDDRWIRGRGGDGPE
jgi:predicted CoA-binding protein